MLFRSIAEGGRAMVYFAGQYADHMTNAVTEGDQKKYQHWDDKLGFLTPILKGFLTELGLEAANHGMQVFGGHGYIKEHGMEQIVRDARISTLYEGTTGIQALDLLGRKTLIMTRGKAVRDFTGIMLNFCKDHALNSKMRPFVWQLSKLAAQWNMLTVRTMLTARKDREIVAAAAYDFMMYSGYATMAYFWAVQAAVAFEKLEKGGAETPEFYTAKIQTAEFYFDRLLPRAKGHVAGVVASPKSLMQMSNDDFAMM